MKINNAGNVKFDFTGERFIVTGASSGIGRCIATELIDSGAEVLAIARRKQVLEELKMYCPQRITIAPIDVTHVEMLRSVIDSYAALGKIAGSVHAAGVNRFTPLRAFNRNDAIDIMETTLWAGIDLIRLMSRKKYMSATMSHVMIGSVAGMEGCAGLTGYSAAKSAVINAARTMALELASKYIRINAVSPGWVESDMTKQMKDVYPDGIQKQIEMHPLGIGQAIDVSNMTLFLLSDRAKWITGGNFVVDGGYMA